MKKYSVITITYNSKSVIKDTFIDLLNREDVEIYVVDNASSDNTVKYIESLLASNVNLIKNEKNIGYGRATNIALEKINSEFVLLLNPDANIKYNALEELSKSAINNNLDIVSPILSDDYEKNGIIENDNFHDEEFVIFGLCLIKKEVFTKIGKIDENIFMYYEDLDFCYRARNLGLKVCQHEGIYGYHKGGGSSTQNFKILYIKEKNLDKARMYFKMKHYGNKYNFYILHTRYAIKYFIRILFSILRLNLKEIIKFYARFIGVIQSFLLGKIYERPKQ